jgi:hypothetical protein
MATSSLTSFEELINRARHSPSIAFEKTRGGVETIDTMLTNSRLPRWLEAMFCKLQLVEHAVVLSKSEL